MCKNLYFLFHMKLVQLHMQTAFYLPQVSTLTVLHGQQRQIIGGHQFLHSFRNFSGSNHVHMIQPKWKKGITMYYIIFLITRSCLLLRFVMKLIWLQKKNIIFVLHPLQKSDTRQFVPFQAQPIQACSYHDQLSPCRSPFYSPAISNSFIIPHTTMSNWAMSRTSQFLCRAEEKKSNFLQSPWSVAESAKHNMN